MPIATPDPAERGRSEALQAVESQFVGGWSARTPGRQVKGLHLALHPEYVLWLNSQRVEKRGLRHVEITVLMIWRDAAFITE